MMYPAKSNIIRYSNIALPQFKYIRKQIGFSNEFEKILHILIHETPLIKFSEQTWHKSTNYLYAIDLFNHQFYWEVHEVLEILWMEKEKNSPTGKFIQGIIQLSAALLKKKQSNRKGQILLAEKALSKLNLKSGIYLGINIQKLIIQFNSFVNADSEHPPLIILNFDSIQ